MSAEKERARYATQGRIEFLRRVREEEEAGQHDALSTKDHYISGSGAKSSEKAAALHLVPFGVFLLRLAKRYSDGAAKYGEGNWMKGLGDRDYVLERANHTLIHLLKAIDAIYCGDPGSDDDLAAAMWGIIFLMAAQRELGIIKE